MATSEFVCGTGEWVGPKPGDPDNNIVLNATGTFGGIDVSWSYPATNPYAVAHTVLYRGLTDNFAGAVQHTIVAGNYFFDKFDGAGPVVYYYWVQMVSVNGTYASIVGPATATARPSIEDTIRQLSGKIDQGALAQELRSNIDHIGLLDNSISGEIQDRIAANQALGVALNGVQTDVDAAVTLIETEVTERINANSALLTSMNLMGVGFQNSVAGLVEEVELVATANTALASKITTVEATVNGDTATGQVGLTAKVNSVTGAVESMYTAKVQTNGLIGGFGIVNDGELVEAGFDVDRFWVGRTDANKMKPFIIENDEVFINKAVIQTLTADMIDTRGLVIRDTEANGGGIIFGAGNALDWSRVGGGNKPADGATVGANSSNLTIGVGVNLLPNSNFLNGSLEGWGKGDGWPNNEWGTGLAGWDLDGNESTAYLHQTTGYVDNWTGDLYATRVPVVAGTKYEAYAYTGSHRALLHVLVAWYNSSGTYLGENGVGTNDEEVGGGTALSGYKKTGGFALAPAGAATAMFFIRKHSTKNGYGDSWAFIARAFFGEALPGQTELSPWSPGSVQGVRTLGYSGDLDATKGMLSSEASSAYTANNGWTMNKDGTFSANGGGNKILVGTNTALIQFNKPGGGTAFAVDSSGSAIFGGTLLGAVGTFSGTLSAGVLDMTAFDAITYTYSTGGSYQLVIPEKKTGWSAMHMRVTLVGGGGGGGGGAAAGAPNRNPTSSGGGGGAGQKTTYVITSGITSGSTLYVSVGGGGSGGIADTNWTGSSVVGSAGGSGGSSAVSLGASYYSAAGGAGGGAGTSALADDYGYNTNGTGGGAGGSVGGQAGSGGFRLSAVGGTGGSSEMGTGGSGGTATYQFAAPGTDGGVGAGGGGGGADASHSNYGYAANGGNGGNGYILVEFFDPNTVVLNSRYSALVQWLDSIGHGSVPAAAR